MKFKKTAAAALALITVICAVSAAPAANAADYADYRSGQPTLSDTEKYTASAVLEKERVINEGMSAEVTVDLEKDGDFAVEVEFVLGEGNNAEAEYAFSVDGDELFDGLRNLTLSKVYKDAGKPTVNERGDEIRPEQEECPQRQTAFISDPMGYENEPYIFRLAHGSHKLKFTALRGDITLYAVCLTNDIKIPTDEEYLSGIDVNKSAAGEKIKIDAEFPAFKSSPMLFASCDKTSYYADPYPNGKTKLNVIGGDNFGKAGQWLYYETQVKTEGIYYLEIKYKQNTSVGMASYRKIYIDGKTPCESFSAVAFPYSTRWESLTVSDTGGKALPLYLTAGKHTIKLETVLGDYGSIVEKIEKCVTAMNEAYLESIMYLTSSPDTNRDYAVEKNLPGVIAAFKEQAEYLREVFNDINAVAGGTNDSVSIIERFIRQLDEIVKDPETYPKRLSSVKSNITSLAALITSLSAQPLTLDYLTLYTESSELKPAEAGFFKNLLNEMINFWVSFADDYQVRSESEKSGITVWIPAGRDQYDVLNRLIEDSFTPQSGIEASLRLVSEGALLPATVAGIGPDVIIQIGNGSPMNYAVRGAVYDISRFSDYEEIAKRFSPAAAVPLTLSGAVYGLPETEQFFMMFYRTDILKRLDLEAPRTWDEFLVAVTEMQKNNLAAGLPGSLEAYAMILLQRGGSVYSDKTYECAMNSTVGVKVFTYFTDMFTNYGFPLTYDALTRFRMGEMPIVIADYTFFNSLQVGAPEISDLWKMAAVPGTEREDGTVDNSTVIAGNACMMLKAAKDPEKAWEFMKWWTSAETQTAYGRNMEMILGTSGRVATANLEAAAALSWSKENSDAISAARLSVKGLENVPGSYFLSRHFTNAFRKVVISGGDAKEAMRYYTKIINNEINSKCAELGVSVERKQGV